MTNTGANAAEQQFDIFGELSAQGWPPHARFPYNDGPTTVGSHVLADLAASRAPLVITGYASLDRLIRWLAQCQAVEAAQPGTYERIRLLLGHEPTPTARVDFRTRAPNLGQEVTDYWLGEGISLYLSAQLVAALDLIERGRLDARTSGEVPVHAKVYVGDHAVTIGSSNFSASGLTRQVELNTRFTADESERFAEARRAAEVIWARGRAYTSELKALLTQLLRVVTWQEALARACAELLEGKWAARYAPAPSLDSGPPLWPAQEQGIAHALWILENQGSVLVADATGSGKTRMGAHLARRIVTRAWRTGRARNDITVLMAPPSVLDGWHREALACGLPLQIYSQGHLSHGASLQHSQLLEAIRRAQLLIVDEAHGFLRRSARTKALFGNMADHVVLFTATPVSRGPRDMLAIIDLLGADNLDAGTLGVLEQLWRRRGELNETMSAGERETLRRAIRQFTLRRTKSELNRMIELAPDRYRDRAGRLCSYPRHAAFAYETGETDADRGIAARILDAASRLRGIARLQSPLEVSESQRREGVTDDAYLAWRLRGAAALAAHQVMSSLRSSRARLAEHLHGTVTAGAAYPSLGAAKRTRASGVLDQLSSVAGTLPDVHLGASAPAWLRDAAAHAAACAEEYAVYEEIAALAQRLTDARERTKADLLLRLARERGLVLAFDTYLITLAALEDALRAAGASAAGVRTVLATGEHVSGRRELRRLFRQDSSAHGIIALCSDALSEGVNLQAASAVVLLDMPSVLRVAEQRIGRVDRLDSPHGVIEAWWPKDSPEFALRASERFVERHRFVADHLGSNLPLPDGVSGVVTGAANDPVIGPEEDIGALEHGDVFDDLQDAFAPVRALVEGASALVPAPVYNAIRGSTARVVSSVSVVAAPTHFAFVAVMGTEYGAPRWVYLDGGYDVPGVEVLPVTDLDAVSSALRRHLTTSPHDREFDTRAAGALERVLTHLERHEELLLPRGKQRAVAEMRHILRAYRRSVELGDTERIAVLDALLAAVAPGVGRNVDLAVLAEWWLHVLQPLRHRHLTARRRTAPVLLKHLRPDLKREPLSTADLRTAFDRDLTARPLAERVAAAIIGVPER